MKVSDPKTSKIAVEESTDIAVSTVENDSIAVINAEGSAAMVSAPEPTVVVSKK